MFPAARVLLVISKPEVEREHGGVGVWTRLEWKGKEVNEERGREGWGGRLPHKHTHTHIIKEELQMFAKTVLRDCSPSAVEIGAE